jgi:hypothetical protein
MVKPAAMDETDAMARMARTGNRDKRAKMVNPARMPS